METAVFESLPLSPIDDVIFALRIFWENFFRINRGETACYHYFKNIIKHHIIIVFGGLSLQESAHGRSQEFGFGAALKGKFQSHGHYVSANANFSFCTKNVHAKV